MGENWLFFNAEISKLGTVPKKACKHILLLLFSCGVLPRYISQGCFPGHLAVASHFKLVFQLISQGKVRVLAHPIDLGSASLKWPMYCWNYSRVPCLVCLWALECLASAVRRQFFHTVIWRDLLAVVNDRVACSCTKFITRFFHLRPVLTVGQITCGLHSRQKIHSWLATWVHHYYASMQLRTTYRSML